VAFFLDFPSDVADEARNGSEEKFTFVHCELARLQNFSNVLSQSLHVQTLKPWYEEISKIVLQNVQFK
jgi:hypothetical protein